MSLEKYNEKRDFSQTKEPKGITKKTQSKSLKFVIQFHRATTDHYDLRLEYNGVLLSWAVPKGLSTNPNVKRLAVMVEEHPIKYADFEGVIPKGNYGAGVVEIFDSGTYEQTEDFKLGLKNGNLKFFLNGNKLKGLWTLVKTDKNNWLVIKINDKFTKKEEKTSKKPKNPFKNVPVMLATLSNNIPTGKDWLFEIKYDGYRITAYKSDKSVQLFSRNGNDYSKKFSSIVESVSQIAKDIPFVLDGEVVSFNKDGVSDFSLLQQNIKSSNDNFSYVVFDLLALNGKDLRNTPLIERKEYLKNILEGTDNKIIYSTHVIGNGKKCFNLAKKLNLEGIVAKKINSTYVGNRNEDWLKIKCYKRQEFIIIGFTTTEKNKILSAILVGFYKDNALIFAGKVGTGFSENMKKELVSKFKKIETNTCPLAEKIDIKANWLKPKLIAEIKYAEFTKDGLLRQPSFVGLREDKKPSNVVLEEKGGS